jgi:hypothetical protein
MMALFVHNTSTRRKEREKKGKRKTNKPLTEREIGLPSQSALDPNKRKQIGSPRYAS